jgi:hypothetical protein
VRLVSRPARYFVLFAALWIIAMTWKLYPQFPDTLRVEGRVVALDDYVEDACNARVGPDAASCVVTTLEDAGKKLRMEQAKSLLLVEAPLILFAVLYLPLRLLRRSRG